MSYGEITFEAKMDSNTYILVVGYKNFAVYYMDIELFKIPCSKGKTGLCYLDFAVRPSLDCTL